MKKLNPSLFGDEVHTPPLASPTSALRSAGIKRRHRVQRSRDIIGETLDSPHTGSVARIVTHMLRSAACLMVVLLGDHTKSGRKDETIS